MNEHLSPCQRAWRQKLAGQPAYLNLPFDRPRPTVMSRRVDHLSTEYSDALLRDIQAIAEACQLTPFVLLETCWAIVCAQLAHSQDVLIGTVAKSSYCSHAETVNGLPGNVLVLPHRVQANGSVLRHWREGAEALSWGWDHSALPFADMVAAVNPLPSAAYHPLFQVFCQWQQEGLAEPITFPGAVATGPFLPTVNGPGVDMAIVFQYGQDGLRTRLSYSTDLFDRVTIEALLSLYGAFLSQSLQAPQASIATIWQKSVERLQVSEHATVLNGWMNQRLPDTGAWYPLSLAQQDVWLQEQAAPKGSSYQALAVMRCTPSVDRVRLEKAAQALIVQHQLFSLEWRNTGFQHQALVPIARFIRKVDETSISRKEQEQVIRDWHEQLSANLDDKVGTVAVFHWPDSVWIALRAHHVMHDGWSSIKYCQRIATNYAQLKKEPSYKFEMDRYFLDTLKLEQAYLSSADYAQDALFWKERCASMSMPPLVNVLADRPYTTDITRQVDSVTRTLSPLLQAALQRVAKDVGASLAECLTALTSLYMARVSGEGDLVLGVAFLNRMRDTLDMPGQFAKALPMGVSLDLKKDTLWVAIKKVCEAFRQTLQHGRYPFGGLVRHCGLDARHTEISVNTLFLKRDIELEGELAQVQWLSGPESGLSLLYTQFGREAPMNLELRFNAALFDKITVELHANRLLRYLERTCEDLQAIQQEVPILLDEERRLLLEEWNETQRAYPQDQCIHQLFEEQVARTPQAIAVVHGDEQVSYAELNARANRVAHRLIEAGVRPDDRVAICVERSVRMVVGLLGILKAGGAYVPLDPTYPSERLGHIMTDANPRLLLVDSGGRKALGEVGGVEQAQCLTMDDPYVCLTQSSTNPQVAGLSSRHLAYVIYTSGSTGLPKGVMVEHRGLVNLASEYIEQFGLMLGHRFTATAGVAFDASAGEIWPALASGMTLQLPPVEVANDPASLLQWWRGQDTDSTFLVTPLARLAVEQGLPANLRQLQVAGEAITPTLWQTLSRSENLKSYNLYGPTECTVGATLAVINATHSLPVIGRPIANTRIYLLDEQQQPVPLGAVGEIYIGGDGVARGYWNRPELTAQRFLRDPFSDKAQARMYRTGDLGKYLLDGNLVYLGRNDQQVKIRGFRIEPGEIEARLLEQAGVREAAVLAREDVVGEKRLVAYVVLAEQADREGFVATCRTRLSQCLPEYMLPSAIVQLDGLPLTPNGKLDRQALPAPDEQSYAREQYEAPQGELERSLAAIWQELLGVARVGRHDNFFALGGHSLLAVRLLGLTQDKLSCLLTLNMLYEFPTIGQLAERLGMNSVQAERSHALDILLPLSSRGDGYPLFCFHPAGGCGWAYSGLLPYIYNRPLYALQSRAFSEPGYEAKSIEVMAVDYLAHIRKVQAQGPYYLLGWSLGSHIAHAVATQLQREGEEVGLLVMLDGYPHDVLTQAPLPGTQSMEEHGRGFVKKYMEELGHLVRDFGDFFLDKFTRQMLAGVDLTRQFRPERFHGDLVFFRACADEYEKPSSYVWSDFVSGKIQVHDISCTHDGLMKKEALEQLGPVLVEVLNAAAGTNTFL